MEKITDDELEEIAGGISAFDSIKVERQSYMSCEASE